jgi:hypothetical protein
LKFSNPSFACPSIKAKNASGFTDLENTATAELN